MKTTTRYIISITETFVSAFLGTFFLQIENILNIWWIPTKELLISAIIAWVISWVKLIIKPTREYILNMIK